MRAIIIDDKDARELLDQLKLDQFKQLEDARLEYFRQQHPETWAKEVVGEIHRRFHFVVTRWLQDQGADCVR